MKGKIHLLSESAINQIAAGEVIENSASVVKELIENAIDAGATEIKIDTKKAGQFQIKVSDDGCGMTREDLLLSIERHATSKLYKIEDLFSLSTLGFRGEALASIASISKLSIHSSLENEGTILLIEGGKLLKEQIRPRQKGTTVEVNSLFYNLSARKKFQKSVQADLLEIRKVITQLALCYSSLSFEWINDGKQEAFFPSFEERVPKAFGPEVFENLIASEHHRGDFHLKGWISRPHFHAPNRTGQHLFINQRPVVSKLVAEAISEGYGHRLALHRFPFFALHLTLPSALLDVNVHPRKKEVRFREESKLKDFLIESTIRSLETIYQSAIETKMVTTESKPFSLTLPSALTFIEKEQSSTLPYEKKWHVFYLFGDYLFVQKEPGEILIIDQLRARRRIFYEKIEEKKQVPAMQMLLSPIVIEKNREDAEVIIENLELLNKLGIAIRLFGETAFLIDSIPEIFSEEETKEVIDVLLLAFRGKEKAQALFKFCSKIKRKVLSLEEGEKLVRELFLCKICDHCPEGRPIFLELTEEKLRRLL